MKTSNNIFKTLFMIVNIFIITVLPSGNLTAQENNIPEDLQKRFNEARLKGNLKQAKLLNDEIEKYLDVKKSTIAEGEHKLIIGGELGSNDWYNNDITLFSGSMGDKDNRIIDIKQGPDGWLYAAAIVKNVLNFPYGVRLFCSSNGGAVWNLISTTVSNNYYNSLSLLVESRNDNNPDSTRLIVFFTSSPLTNGDNSNIIMTSIRRNSTGGQIIILPPPASGNKYEHVSACSDGMYYSNATYLHVIVREAANGGAFVGFRHFRTTNWGESFSSSLITTSYPDYYPSAAYLRTGGSDSVVVAFERRISANETYVRVLFTTSVPTSVKTLRYPGMVGNYLYEKPCLTIAQQSYNISKKMMISFTKNGVPYYFYSVSNGETWSSEINLANKNTIRLTWCASDSLQQGGNFVLSYLNFNADSISVFRGTPGIMFLNSAKANKNYATLGIIPVCALYKSGTTKTPALLYSGVGRSNLYFNGEHLLTGVQNINSNVPDGYSLSQNYPNPFNPTTNISFSIPKSGLVKLVVYDLLGKQVAELVNGSYNAGTYKVDFDATNLSSGAYFYKITADGFTDIKKMMLVK